MSYMEVKNNPGDQDNNICNHFVEMLLPLKLFEISDFQEYSLL